MTNPPMFLLVFQDRSDDPKSSQHGVPEGPERGPRRPRLLQEPPRRFRRGVQDGQDAPKSILSPSAAGPRRTQRLTKNRFHSVFTVKMKMRVLGLSWLVLACLGLSCPVLASLVLSCPGLSWHVLAYLGLSWPVLASFSDPTWLQNGPKIEPKWTLPDSQKQKQKKAKNEQPEAKTEKG